MSLHTVAGGKAVLAAAGGIGHARSISPPGLVGGALRDMSDEKNPVEQALDVVLYAPIGLVFSARELLPKLAEKGRSQLGVARMMGQFAVQQGQKEAGKLFDKAQGQARTTIEQLGVFNVGGNGSTPAGRSGEPAPAPAPAPADPPAAPNSGPEAASLAIPDYDSLSASQVLPRLSGLSPDELEAVRAYEAEHRGRKTILNRAGQLQSSAT